MGGTPPKRIATRISRKDYLNVRVRTLNTNTKPKPRASKLNLNKKRHFNYFKAYLHRLKEGNSPIILTWKVHQSQLVRLDRIEHIFLNRVRLRLHQYQNLLLHIYSW